MAKKMELIKSGSRIDLSIERDAGNLVLILMGGKDRKTIRDTWLQLKEICDEAIIEIEELNLPETR
jgi:hypothetical protein